MKEYVVKFNMCSWQYDFLETGVKDSCSENFVTFAEKWPWDSLLKEGKLCRVSIFLNQVLREIWFLRNLRNIQGDLTDKSVLLNVIKKRIINFESCSLFRWCEVFVGKNIRQQTCCLYVFCDSSPLPSQGSKSNFHNLRKISTGRHNGCANSEIGYSKSIEISPAKLYGFL